VSIDKLRTSEIFYCVLAQISYHYGTVIIEMSFYNIACQCRRSIASLERICQFQYKLCRLHRVQQFK